jgi:hypothetical protein
METMLQFKHAYNAIWRVVAGRSGPSGNVGLCNMYSKTKTPFLHAHLTV